MTQLLGLVLARLLDQGHRSRMQLWLQPRSKTSRQYLELPEILLGWT
ncbi:hypothetical protein KBC77_03310 [Candidatus Saccharibacteria bacterium]|nr:hypothetical protein [Candidatus Saccharibacteria bacterium]